MWNPGPGATAGDDDFVGDESNDRAEAQAGDDVLYGAGGDDVLYGEAGDDHLMGGDGSDYLDGDEGTDLLEGGAGDDALMGQYHGDDRLFGGDGDDYITIYGSAGAPRTILMDGGDGDDQLDIDLETDMTATIVGGAGRDRIEVRGHGQGQSGSFDAGAGDDTISIDVFGEATQALDFTLGAGRDVIIYERDYGPKMYWSAANIAPIVIHDFETGDAGDTLDLYSLLVLDAPTWDQLSNPFATGFLRLVQDGADTVLQLDRDAGGAVEGWSDFYRFEGVAPAQFTAANFHGMTPDGSAPIGKTIPYPDVHGDVRGTIGDDTITVLPNPDYYGTASYFGRAGDDQMVAIGTNAALYGGAGNDHLVGDWGFSSTPYASGSYLFGEDGDDRLEGSILRDALLGGDGTDILAGGDGDDQLDGGAGDDTIDGGAGYDTISYDSLTTGVSVAIGGGATTPGGTAGVDTISGVEAFLGSKHDDAITIDLGATTGYRVDGGEGSDTITGGGGDDVIIGGYTTAADHLIGRGGVDTVSYEGNSAVRVDLRVTTAQDTGGAGVDTLSGFRNLIGSWFADILIGDAQDNVITGDAYFNAGEPVGSDTIQGLDGNDTLIGGGGQDKLYGQAGADILNGGNGYDLMAGGDGDDVLDGGADDDFMVGENGADRMLGGAGADLVDGGAGDDVIDGGAGNDTLTGADGLDVLTYASATQGVVVSLLASGPQNTVGAGIDNIGQFETLIGSSYDDVLTGGSLFGMDGADRLFGSAGDDRLNGGAGQDFLTGGLGNDFADGGAADDILVGAAGDDLLIGQDGADTLFGGDGADTLSGGAGDDILHGELGDEPGQADQMFGGTGGDVLLGGAGGDVLHGEAGDDQLLGGAGGDTLLGGDGVDMLDGGAAADVLVGGAGADRFVYNDVSESRAGQADRILDFTSGVDLLDLGRIDADVNIAGNQGFVMVQAFTYKAGEALLKYDPNMAATWFLADTDGDGVSDFALIIDGDHQTADPGWLL